MLKQFKKRIAKYNKLNPLADYLVPLVGDKKEVKILDVGSGPYPITGQLLEGVNVDIRWCDQQDFKYFWDRYNTIPVFKIEQENMEKLSYPDESFDIVHSINALDHTKGALEALKEMIRVCKKGGWVYIDCSLIQHTTRGHRHYWDALENGTFENEYAKFDLTDYGFTTTHIDNGEPRPHQHLIATLQK